MHDSEKYDCLAMVSNILDYYRQPVSEFTLSVWWEGCKPFDLEQVSKALTAHATDPDKGQFAPKVADIIRQLAGTKTDRSLMAWGRVHDAMGRVGAYQDVDFGDSATHAAILDMGGWPKMCRTELSDLSYLQHRFCESYRAYQAQGVTDQPALTGDRSPDEIYLKSGMKPPAPICVGTGKAAPIPQAIREQMAKLTNMVKQ